MITDEKGNTLNIGGSIISHVVRDVEKDGLLGPPCIKNLDKKWYGKKAILLLIEE